MSDQPETIDQPAILDVPPEGMHTYGQRLGARNVKGLANWSDEVIEAPIIGMINVVSGSPHPHDGLYRKAEILIRNQKQQWDVCAYSYYDGNCRQFDYEVLQVGPVAADQRVESLVRRYAAKVGTLDCMSIQKEYPLQAPFCGWLLLRPGEVSVMSANEVAARVPLT